MYRLFFILFFGLWMNSLIGQSLDLVDSLQQLLVQSEGEQKVIYLCDICYELNYRDATEARDYCDQALKLAQQLDYPKGKAAAFQYLGVNEQGQGNYKIALNYQLKALQIYQSLKDTLAVAHTHNNIGIVCDEQGDYTQALEHYLDALKIYEHFQDQMGAARTYNNIGIVYKKQKDYDQVIEYYTKALAIYQEKKHGFGIAVTQGNIGSTFLNLKKYPEAIRYSIQSLNGYDSLDIRQHKPYPLGNIGRAYNAQNKFQQAISYLSKALDLHQGYGNQKEIAFIQNHLATSYLGIRDLKKAQQLSAQSLDLAKKIGAKEEIRNAALTLSQIYEQQKNFTKAYQVHLEYTAIKDTLFEVEKTKRIEALQTQYETARKEQTISLQKLQLQQAETRNKEITGLAIAGILGVSIIALISYFFYTSRQVRLRHQQEKKYEQQLLSSTIAATESERKRIAADLHDGVGQQLTGLKMAWQQLRDQLANKAANEATPLQKLTKVLDDVTTDIRSMSHQMMPKILDELGLEAAVEDMVKQSFSATTIRCELDTFGIKKRLDESVEIGTYRIAQEAINNILKHAQAKEVSIQLYQLKGFLVMSIEDDGCGIPDLTKRPSGHGLMNMQSRAKTMNGQLSLENAMTGGTVLVLRVPV